LVEPDQSFGVDEVKVYKKAPSKKKLPSHLDTKTRRLKKVPDHKTRLAAITLSRAYHEGICLKSENAVATALLQSIYGEIQSSAAGRFSFSNDERKQIEFSGARHGGRAGDGSHHPQQAV